MSYSTSSLNVTSPSASSFRLEEALIDDTRSRSFLGRVWIGLQRLEEEHGSCAGLATKVATFISSGVCFVSVYFSADGAIQILDSTFAAIKAKERLPIDVGHGGEWSAQVLLYLFFYIEEMGKLMREGDWHLA